MGGKSVGDLSRCVRDMEPRLLSNNAVLMFCMLLLSLSGLLNNVPMCN